MQRPSIPTVSALKTSMKRRFLYMPNVDFERSIISSRLAKTLNSPDFKHRLLSVKAYLDYEDQDIVRINFLDTLRPELWCIEGLARHLEPLPGQQYGLHLVESMPRLDVRFEKLPMDNNAWVLFVQVNDGQEIFDDAYFLKKVRDQIGFGSLQNVDVTILPGIQHTLSIETPTDDNSRGRFIAPLADLSAPAESSDTIGTLSSDQEEASTIRRGLFIAPTADLSASGGFSDIQVILPPLTLGAGINTVVITALDQRICAWLFFALLCNYIDR